MTMAIEPDLGIGIIYHCTKMKFISLSYIYERLLYSTGKTSTWCKSAEKPPPPPPPPFLPLVRYSAQIVWHDILHASLNIPLGSWQKSTPPPPTGWGKIFWLQIYPFHAILSNFCFSGRKAPPPPPGWGKFFWLWIYPFQTISSNFHFSGRKAPPKKILSNCISRYSDIWCKLLAIWWQLLYSCHFSESFWRSNTYLFWGLITGKF